MQPKILATAALLIAVLAVGACGDDGKGSSRATATVPSTTPPLAALDGALWPDPAVASADTEPGEVARSFIVDFLRMPNPPLGEFQQGDARSGEIPVYQRGEGGTVNEDRVIATVSLRQLDGVRWFVVAANSPDVQIDEPRVFDEIASPARVAGKGRGFERNIVVAVHAGFDPKPLVEVPLSGGLERVEPFSGELTFERNAAATGAIVARDGGALDGVTNPFAATAIRFAAG